MKALIVLMLFSFSVMALDQNETELISCSLQGKSSAKVLFSINDVTKEISYNFKNQEKQS